MGQVCALHWPGEGPPELAGQGAAMHSAEFTTETVLVELHVAEAVTR